MNNLGQKQEGQDLGRSSGEGLGKVSDARTTYYATYYEDPDGNLISDGRWTNTWNGENRLIKMETRSDLDSSVPDLVLEFEYDSQGRRFKKTVTSNSVSTTTYFLYDGWNLIAELDSSLNPIRTFTWGSDLSGSLQGAGGVGGLLAIENASDAYYVSCDGNGNLTALADSSDGSIQAQYEYNPFGQILRMTGDYAEQNPFRFSTKYQDEETGWVYYGYRYLVPGIGRWANRDPIGEEGGLGLYGFVGNGGVYAIDIHGLFACGKADVTDAFAAIMSDIRGRWKEASPETKNGICCQLRKIIQVIPPGIQFFSWDIHPLNSIGRGGWPFEKSIPQGSGGGVIGRTDAGEPVRACERTVVLGGKCYYGGAANYALFGSVFKLCAVWTGDFEHFSKEEAVKRVIAWKVFEHGGALALEAVGFTKYGYDLPKGALPWNGACRNCVVDNPIKTGFIWPRKNLWTAGNPPHVVPEGDSE